MTDEETLAHLRRRVAATENLGTLRHLADAASALASVAPESLLSGIGDLQDRIASKLERLGAPPVRRKQAVDPEVLAVTDDDPLLRRLCAKHGEPRADIAPELTAAARRTP
jgi:hypothetical protein